MVSSALLRVWLLKRGLMLTHGLSALPLPVVASLFSVENVFHSWANECYLCPFILHLVWESPPHCTHQACTNLTSSPPSTSHRKRNIAGLVLWFQLANLKVWIKPWLRGHFWTAWVVAAKLWHNVWVYHIKIPLWRYKQLNSIWGLWY